METPAKTVLGGSLISVLAVTGMLVVGVTAGVVAGPGAPPARAADGLRPFEDCEALRDWYVEHTIDQVGPYGWGGRNLMYLSEPGFAPGSAGAAEGTDSATRGATEDATREGVGNGATGTNTQEAGVDEPDIAKTDGRIVVQIKENQRLVITDVGGSDAREIAEWRIPRGSFVDGLLLVGDHVLLAGGRTTGIKPMGEVLDRIGPIGGSAGTELIDLDISDPAAPRLAGRTTWSGNKLSLRQYGDNVRLVTSTGLPTLPFVQPRPGRLTEDEAEQKNRETVRSSTLEDWVPGFSSDAGSGPLVSCDEVYHPKTWSGADTVAVATFQPGSVDDASAVAVTGAGAEVYSSVDRLYVSGVDWGDRWPVDGPRRGWGPDSSVSNGIVAPTTDPRTHVHAFSLEGDVTRYVASGELEGSVRDRWSLDEFDGHLRVAVSWSNRRGITESGIVVLAEQDGRLEPVGAVRGLGVDEQIQSVRWFDDLAVVVTFRQIDPLYTIDLRDPANPRRLGELKIPGFSSYLHPIGDDKLLGLGTDAASDGRVLGAQAAVYDITDPTRARQVGKVTFGGESHLVASEDPHAFTWLPGANAAITSLQRWNPDWNAEQQESGIEMVLLRIAPSGEVSTERLPSPGGRQSRALPLEGGRVALAGEQVEIIDLEG